MEYFILRQDIRISDAIQPVGVSQVVKDYGLPSESWDDLDDLPMQFYLEGNGGREYVDFIESPVPLISAELKELYQKFDPTIFFKPIVLADQEPMRQELYWLIHPPQCDCKSAESEFDKNGSLQRLVIDHCKTKGMWLFRVAGIRERLIVVNLGVAECILRREFTGIRFERVDCR
jgi:hypothetical protein